jgi:hypothetical protein
MAEPAKIETKKQTPLTVSRFQESSYAQNTWFVTAPPHTKVEDLLEVEYWRHVGDKLKPFDEIKAITEDGLWYARFLVVSCDRVWAKVKLLEQHDLSVDMKEIPLSSNDNYSVKWKGPIGKYAVVRKSDGSVLKDGLTTQLDGYQWLDGYIKSLAA